MQEKINLSIDAIDQILQTETFEQCWDALANALPDIWPRVHPNQLPDVINHHINAVWKRGASDPYDPPGDPGWVFKIPNK